MSNIKKPVNKSIPKKKNSFKNIENQVVNKQINQTRKKINIDLSKEIKNQLIYENIKVACILDEFSYRCFKYECNLIQLKPDSWKQAIIKEQPDLLFVESAWVGLNGEWTNKITKPFTYEDNSLKDLVNWCKKTSIPTVFWCKEDPYDFDIFIEASKLFDYVFTTDENCIPKYKEILKHDNVFLLPFAAQPRIHNPILRASDNIGKVAFAGGWYEKELGKRKENMYIILKPAFKYGLRIYDRFSEQECKPGTFPEEFFPYVTNGLPYNKIIEQYKKYDVFLNVNSVENSPTTFARRVFELLACGTPVISSYSLGIENFFKDIVKLCNTSEDTEKYLKLLLENKNLRDKISAMGQREVFEKHTYKHRLETVLNNVGIEYIKKEQPSVSVITCTKRANKMENVLQNYNSQTYPNKELIIVLNNNSIDIDSYKKEAAKYKNIKVYQLDENKSLGECLNYAIEKSSMDIIAKFDDDDFYGANYLVDSINAFKYTNAHIVGKYTVYAYMEDIKMLVLRYPNRENRYMEYVSGSTLVFKKEIFTKVKFQNITQGEDTNFLEDCIKAGYKIYATDRFNHVICRRKSLNEHSWKISQKDFLRKCQIISITNSYKNYVSI